MEARNIDQLILEIKKCVDKHNLGKPGEYCRWRFGENVNIGLNEYGCADAANILYTIGYFPKNIQERECWIKTMQNMQNPETGMWSEPTHHTIHTTAHVSAALELFDAEPLYKCTALEKYTTKEGLYELLEKEVDWSNPWPQSHKGAGILPILTNTNMISIEWKNWYFDWMWEHSNADNGFFCIGTPTAPLYENMAAGFHYIFNHECEHRPLRYPEKIIDSCLHIIENKEGYILRTCEFVDIDVVYCLTRAMRQTPYKFYEGKKALEQFAEEYLDLMYSFDYENDVNFNDMHRLFGAVCCLAELQSALPGKIITSRPLKIVLDRRPFI